MHTAAFSENELLDFTASEPLPYGNRITLNKEPVANGSNWITTALLSPSGKEAEVFLNSNLPVLDGQSFIVLRWWRDEDRKYSHQAVLVERLREKVQEIEREIIELLSPAP